MSLIRSHDWLRHEANRAWTIHPGAVPTPQFVGDCPRPSSDRSLCLSRLTFQPFHPQPPHLTISPRSSLARYVIVVTCRVYPRGDPEGQGICPSRSQGFAIYQEGSPTGSAESGSPFVTDWLFSSGCSPPLLLKLPVTSVGFRPVTLAWKGLHRFRSSAFADALARSVPRPEQRSARKGRCCNRSQPSLKAAISRNGTAHFEEEAG